MHKIQLKVPFNGSSVLPGVGLNIIKSPETEKLRTKRENVATRLQALTGLSPTWHPREYCYRISLTSHQVTEIEKWEYIRHVKKE